MLKRYSVSFYEVIRQAGALHYGASLYTAGGALYSSERDEFSAFLDQLKLECDALGLGLTGDLVAHTKSRFVKGNQKYTHTELVGNLDTLIFSFGNELQTELFFRIPKDKEPFFQSEALFGHEGRGVSVSH